jgi:hypothetical protein
MKSFILILLTIFILCSCQVKEQNAPTNEIIAGHKSYPNAFVIMDPLPGNYTTGDTVSFTMHFPVPVTVDATLGVPYLMLEVGGNLIGAEYVSGDGTTDLIFGYVVSSIDTDTNGIDIFSLAFNGAVITFINGSEVKACQSAITPKHISTILIN